VTATVGLLHNIIDTELGMSNHHEVPSKAHQIALLYCLAGLHRAFVRARRTDQVLADVDRECCARCRALPSRS
jgi:hypothetical protein